MSGNRNWGEEAARARQAFETNRRLVLAGEKYRAQKPPPPRRSRPTGTKARKIC